MLKQYFYALLATAVTHALLSTFVYLKGRRRLTNCAYAGYSAAIALWSAGEAFAITATDRTHALWLWRLNHIGVIFIPIFFVHFVTSLLTPDEKQRKISIGISYAIGFFFLVLDLAGILIAEVQPKFHFRYFINSTPIYPVFFSLWIGWAVFGLIRLFRVYRDSGPSRKNQLSYFSISMLVAYAGGVPNFIPTFDIEIPFLMPFGTYAIPIYGLFTAYAIVKHRLMDISVALTRTTIFLLVYAIMLGIPAILVPSAEAFLRAYLGDYWLTVVLFSYGGLASAAPFLYSILQRKAEDRLLREQRRYQQTLLQASRGMTLIKDLNHLLRLIVHILTRTVRVTHAAIYVFNERDGVYERKAVRDKSGDREGAGVQRDAALISYLAKVKGPLVAEEMRLARPHKEGSVIQGVQTEMERLRAAVIVPSFVREELLGFLVLGEKKTGEVYSEDDLSVFSTLANQAALAIENCDFIQRAETTQAQLFQAAKMADLGTMAAGIAHQINNRLNVVRVGAECCYMVDLLRIRRFNEEGNAEAVRKQCDDLEVSLKKIAQSAVRGAEISRRLLDFSRAKEGFGDVSIAEVVENCLKLWECKRDLSVITFQNELPKELPQVHGNFSHIEEMLFNLLDNAYDAITEKERARQQELIAKPEAEKEKEKGKGSVRVEGSCVEREGRKYVEVRVKDTGVGMNEEVRKGLFVPFFTTKATAEKGTGLGLFVIKRMLDAHKGEIEVESEYGVGTTFRIWLPVRYPS